MQNPIKILEEAWGITGGHSCWLSLEENLLRKPTRPTPVTLDVLQKDIPKALICGILPKTFVEDDYGINLFLSIPDENMHDLLVSFKNKLKVYENSECTFQSGEVFKLVVTLSNVEMMWNYFKNTNPGKNILDFIHLVNPRVVPWKLYLGNSEIKGVIDDIALEKCFYSPKDVIDLELSHNQRLIVLNQRFGM